VISPVIAWEQDTASLTELVDVFVTSIDTTYISFSEIQLGRAESEHQWSAGLRSRVTADLALAIGPWDPRATHRLAVARIGLVPVALALVAFHREADRPYAVIEDLVADQRVRRQGIGRALLQWVLDVCAIEGIHRVFLESGLRNTGAHQFFEHAGFRPIATVFVRD
jgi:GNAT superfamily N-acetyltransferase